MRNNKTSISFMKHLMLLILVAVGITSCSKDDVKIEDPDPVAIDYHQTAPTQFIDADGAKYAYRVLGDKSGTPLVLVSALGSGMDDWDPAVTNGLAQHYKVILFDNKGVGSSTGSTPATIADMAKDAVSFIKALGYTKVNLMGFSMGGFVSQQIVLTEPGLVNKLILTGTGPKGSEGLSNLPNLLAAGADLSPEERFLSFAFTASEASRKAGEASWDRSQKRTEDRDAALSNETGVAQLTAVLAWAQPYPDALKELSTVTQPTLIVEGEEDIPVPVINSINMSKAIPNAHLVLYPDAGHASFAQYYDKFVHEAISFLNK